MLPDANTGQISGILADKLSWCKPACRVDRKAKTATTVQAEAFFDLRSFSEGGSEGCTNDLYCPCQVVVAILLLFKIYILVIQKTMKV